VLIRGNHEAFNRLARDETIHYFGNVCDSNASIKKVIRLD